MAAGELVQRHEHLGDVNFPCTMSYVKQGLITRSCNFDHVEPAAASDFKVNDSPCLALAPRLPSLDRTSTANISTDDGGDLLYCQH